jgi:hypothetical protein
MTVDCAGLDADGQQVSARWCFLAESDAGPNVPVLPAVALTRALIHGDIQPGADIALLPLQAIEAEMQAPALKITRTVIKAGEHNSFECGLDFKHRAKRRNAAKRAEAARL